MHFMEVAFYKHMPVFRWLMAFVAGIIVVHYLPAHTLLFTVVIGLLGLLIAITFVFLPLAVKYRYRWMQGVGWSLILLAAGMVRMYTHQKQHQLHFVGNLENVSPIYELVIQEPPVEKAKTYKVKANIVAVQNSRKQWVAAQGGVWLYVNKQQVKADSLYYGRHLMIAQTLQPIQNSGNPGAFDYRRYCAFQGMYYQCFVKPENLAYLNHTTANRLWELVFGLQSNILHILRQYITTPDELGIAEALLIGYRADLSSELLQAYSNTGIVHIIAISGLHLAMLYGLLMVLLSPLGSLKGWLKWVRPVLMMIFLWLFTLLAGAQPSVLRSAIMISCLIVGKACNKKTSQYNLLAVSAMAILIVTPSGIFDVGFQLSYAAVLSIALFAKALQQVWIFQNKLLAGVWQLMSVTLAAQILTLPIVLFHFHQMPLLFLGANLIAVPLSGCVLYATLLLLPLSYVPALAKLLGSGITIALHWLNHYVSAVSQLPGSVVQQVHLNLFEVTCMFVLILMLFLWWYQKSATHFVYALGCWCCLQISIAVKKWETHQQLKLVIYNIPKHTGMDVVQGNTYAFIGNQQVLTNLSLRYYHLLPARTANRTVISQKSTGYQVFNEGLYAVHRKILWVRQPIHPTIKPIRKLKVDVAVLCGNVHTSINTLYKYVDVQQIVIDNSNALWKIREWKKECEQLHLRHHFTGTQGAYIVQL